MQTLKSKQGVRKSYQFLIAITRRLWNQTEEFRNQIDSSMQTRTEIPFAWFIGDKDTIRHSWKTPKI